MKKARFYMTLVVLVAMGLTMSAQYTQTDRIAQGVLSGVNSVLDAQQRKQRAEILSREKALYQSTFNSVMNEARELEENGNYAEALAKYEEASELNWKYGYADQRNITRKINSLYGPAGRTDDGPSVLNNDKVTLADYSGYRLVRENPIYKADKNAGSIKILRVCCSDTETRVEFEYENDEAKAIYVSVPSDTHIKGKKSGKLNIVQVQNVGVKPSHALIEQPYQKLRFALIFPALSLEDSEFELKMPGKYWNFKKIPCK
ncbi:MAG: hypothetical protein J5629_05115 [Muribaculaceae bacterium]|nr:hypothetical protein [Muribaculaceae bacterium]